MRMWEIRENSEYPKYGKRSSMRNYKDEDYEMSEDSEEAYECGYEDGYKDAMKKLHYSERKLK